jgi:hypothetical protein
LSEDNGAYVIAFDAALPADIAASNPELTTLRAGQRVLADGRAWDVASVVQAKLLAAQGELPRPPRLEGSFTVVDLRNSAGEVATLDTLDAQAVGWSTGRAVALSELALQGLKDDNEKTLKGQSLPCPNCGAALEVKLASTQSITCTQCASVVDVSKGVGADLAHYQQNNSGLNGAEPQLPLGSSGRLALGGEALDWQIVGFQERCDIPEAGDDETTYWREYLLFNRMAGFAFLVDSEEGWSWVKPLTGVPAVRGTQATWQGAAYEQRWRYGALVTWVQGEFYWRLQQGERADVTDYEGKGANSALRLSREATGSEVTWSAGSTLSADTIARAFGIKPEATAALQRDAGPISSGLGLGKALLIFVVIVVILLLFSRCSSGSSSSDCSEVRSTFGESSAEYRQCLNRQSSGGVRPGGGSFGGFSSGGGGHK